MTPIVMLIVILIAIIAGLIMAIITLFRTVNTAINATFSLQDICGYLKSANDCNQLLQSQIDELHIQIETHKQAAKGNYWGWQGDGEDHPESLTCPIMIHPSKMMKILKPQQKEI